jgi:3-hydroxyisobutyrate dehydrogenase-like beta-hydroxyacid dehydrogenase
VFEQNLPLLKSFSSDVIHLGEIGYGSTAKLINNMLAFCNAAAAAEALMMGKRSGIDLKKLDAVIRNASGMSSGYANLSTKVLAGDYTATFALNLAHKDLRLALELADELGVPGVIAPQVMNLMRMARGMGLGESDSASVMRVYETTLGEDVRA